MTVLLRGRRVEGEPVAVNHLMVRGRYPHRGRSVGLLTVTTAFAASLGVNAALAVCASPATQLTGGVTESDVVTFSNTNGGHQTVSAGGLILSNCGNNNSTTIAAAFANLANGGAPASPPSGCTVNGTSLNGWTTGAASSSAVTFTSTTPNTNVADISFGGQATVSSTTQGSASSTLAAGLSGKTVCVGTTGNWTNQEYHNGATGGSIIDWKQGASNPRDPTATIGTWSVSGSQVTYTYTAGGSYSYTVWQQTNGTYDFCNGTIAIVSGAKVLTGQSAC